MKPLVRLSLAVLVAVSLTACGDDAAGQLDTAQVRYAEQDYQGARAALISALEDEPGNRAALALLVRTQIALGDPASAERALGRLLRAGGGGGGASVLRLKAGIALLQGRPGEATRLLAGDGSTEAWNMRAQACLALGDERGAVSSFDKGMAAGKDIALAVAYARYRLETGDLGGVERILARMQSFAPGAYNTLVLAGDLANERGRTDAAIAAYEKAVSAFPARVVPMLALANAYDAQGRVDEAMAVVLKAQKIAAGDPAVDDLYIQLLSEKGKWEEIRLALQGRDTQLDPSSGLGMTYAEALLHLGQAEQARVMFSRALLLQPGNPYSRLRLGEAQLATGDAGGAWETLRPLAASALARPEILDAAQEAARSVGDPQAEVLKARLDPVRLKAAMAQADKGQAALAAQDWSGAVAIYLPLLGQGEDPEVLKRLAFASLRLGRAKEALAYADRALAADPDNPDCLRTAGVVRLEAGRDIPAARRLLEAAAAADPRNQDIARDLAKAKAAAG
ncbi:tetratricopeptide repeat protein [Novosphingobium aerophilum]|uniref:tetratricopeptide repeat protein n=1 Tax=Novosphingobium TaxID=165696 RepID=UPI002D76D52F|nr:tetratricopeptide repeat protein [Novosphingobium sp. RL4]WRT91621.1 tetratricopeptide repeat protein [Novosphingobium sp. RL4]